MQTCDVLYDHSIIICDIITIVMVIGTIFPIVAIIMTTTLHTTIHIASNTFMAVQVIIDMIAT